MKSCSLVGVRLCLLGCCLIAPTQLRAADPLELIQIIKSEGIVEVSTDGNRWVRTQAGQLLRAQDRLRTGPNSRAALRWSDSSVIPFGPMTAIEIQPPQKSGTSFSLRLIKGVLSFFHRDKPGSIRVLTRGGVAGIDGTEFVIAVDANEQTTVSVIDGRVSFTNEFGPPLVLTNGDQAIASPGRAPQRVAGFVVNHVLQWAFYYPAVLDLRDVALPAAEQRELADSLAAYRAGDLLVALEKFGTRDPASEAGQIYSAALLLSVGEVARAEAVLTRIDQAGASEQHRRSSVALRQLISTVRHEKFSGNRSPESATELLAASYYEQSLALGDATLMRALSLARRATTNSPDFSFAWARVAELEFSFGNACAASEAVTRSLTVAPRNAQALALKGYLRAADNKTREAIEWFERALAVDPSLGNAWLGRGLCRIRRGDTRAGREDLLIAAALEPRRAQLRSYLGKAYADAGESKLALHELDLAKGMDPNDPTAWLYSALAKADHNRINEAIRDLEHAQELNENRSVFRSRLLLDQDRAVQGVNLANIYRDAGMSDWGLREAARSANYDYSSYSAHLFLAGSYNELRDPKLINLRYDTAVNSEFLLANLLAPVSAGTLSPTVTQQEYSRLFERNRLGVISSTEYRSSGDWVQSGAQYGILENSSYSVESFYNTEGGQRPNNDLEQRLLVLRLKQQLAERDTAYFSIHHLESSGGDLAQYYDQQSAMRYLQFQEEHEPFITLGYHREWGPGSHTIALVNWLSSDFTFTNPAQPTLLIFKPGSTVTAAHLLTMHEALRNRIEVFSTELQHILATGPFTTIVGARGQFGTIEADNLQIGPSRLGNRFPRPPTPAADQEQQTRVTRASAYVYEQWQVFAPLRLIAGITYDHVQLPGNFQAAPLSAREEEKDNVSPKAGFILTPLRGTTVRFAYTRSLAGSTFEQAYQLEPAQIAGFVQSFRSLIPESLAGAIGGSRFETFELALDQKLSSETYLGADAALRHSEASRTLGAFESTAATLFAQPSGLRNHLEYTERSIGVSIAQLVGNDLILAARYGFTQSELDDRLAGIPRTATLGGVIVRQQPESLLQQTALSATYNHACGAFFQTEAVWTWQQNDNYPVALAGDDFWQVHVFAGYRFARRKLEISVGLLNATDTDYRLSPLTPYNEMPRERTFVTRLKLNF